MRYKHISQKPYCCVPACVQMVLRRRRLPTSSQEDIAYDLGVILPPSARTLLSKSYVGQKPKAGWGTRINLKRYSLSQFFKKRQYNLTEKYYSPSAFSTLSRFQKFLEKEVLKGHDVLVCFNYPLLYHKKGKWGHASLVEDIKKNSVVLRDPLPKERFLKKVLIPDLFEAMRNHYKGGVWIVKS